MFSTPDIQSENKDSLNGSYENFSKGQVKNILVELERLLIHANIPYPVYFAYKDDDINAVLADVKSSDVNGQRQPATATTGCYRLIISAPEPRKIASPTIINIQGWLPGLKADGDSTQLPTIAIVAAYDTFEALSVGSDSNGSGVAVLLEIARLFSLLYSNPKTRGWYNLLFGLTSAGPYNYNGTYKWLRSFDQRLRESIDYAICLDSIIGSCENDLWIHVSKPPENAYIKQIYEVAWEHEQFSRLRVTAPTLSELAAAPELLDSTGGLYDNRHFMKEAATTRSVKLVAESLAVRGISMASRERASRYSQITVAMQSILHI